MVFRFFSPHWGTRSKLDHKLFGGVTSVTGVYILRCLCVQWFDVNERRCIVKSHRRSALSHFTRSDATMDPCLRALCMTFVLASFTRRSGAVGPVIKCEPCDAGARLLCKPLPKDCVEKIREPGCGCCVTCALRFGQPCGVYTSRCGSGLTCQHQPGETKPLQALLEGRGICVNATSKRLTPRPTPPVNELPGKCCPHGAFYAHFPISASTI